MPGTVVGVASERDVLVLASAGAPSGDAGAIARRSSTSTSVAGKQLHVGDDRLTLVVSRENLHEEARVRAELAARFGGRVRIVDTSARSASSAPASTRRSRTCAADPARWPPAGDLPRGIATSSFRITWMIDRERLDDAVRALHATFIERCHDAVVPASRRSSVISHR